MYDKTMVVYIVSLYHKAIGNVSLVASPPYSFSAGKSEHRCEQ